MQTWYENLDSLGPKNHLVVPDRDELLSLELGEVRVGGDPKELPEESDLLVDPILRRGELFE